MNLPMKVSIIVKLLSLLFHYFYCIIIALFVLVLLYYCIRAVEILLYRIQVFTRYSPCSLRTIFIGVLTSFGIHNRLRVNGRYENMLDSFESDIVSMGSHRRTNLTTVR